MSRTGIRWGLLTVLTVGMSLLYAPERIRAGVIDSPHDFGGRAPDVAPEGSCSACHLPHKSSDSLLWVRSLNGYRTDLTERDGMIGGVLSSSELNYLRSNTLFCYDCHDNHTVTDFETPSTPQLNDFPIAHKPHNIMFGYTKISEGNMSEDGIGGSVAGFYETNPVGPSGSPNYGVNLSAPQSETGGHYFKQDPTDSSTDPLKAGDKLPCRDCHDPHAWASDGSWQVFFRQDWPTTTISQRLGIGANPEAVGSTLTANDLPPGTGTRNDQKSRDLCIACHGNGNPIGDPGRETAVQFRDIRTEYDHTTADTITQAPSTIPEHLSTSTVACVTCHKHNSVAANCSQCHGFPPSDTASPRYPVNAPSTFVPSPDPGANDSHPRHVGNKAGQGTNTFSPYSVSCGICHYGSALGIDSGLGHHQNSKVSVVLDGGYTAAGSGADGTNYYNRDDNPVSPVLTGELDNTNVVGQGWGSGSRYGGNRCRNVYCHSAGRAPASMTAGNDDDYRRPTWNGGILGCNGCHGDPAVDNTSMAYGMPNYPGGTPGSDNANTHAPHVVLAGYECSVCHAGTVSGSGANRTIVGTTSTLHVNRVRNIQFDGSTASGTYDNTPATKTCHVSCHGSDTPRWGGTLANGCFSCHAGAESITKPQDNVSVPNPVDNNEYLHSGHGRSATNYPGSNNLPAGFANYIASPVDCYYCHSQGASHTTKSSQDPFRLGSSADNTTGGMGTWTGAWADNTDVLCLGCHGTASQRSTHDNAAQGTTTIDVQTHAHGVTGTKYTWPVTPWKCVDCHDPHGDGKSGTERYMMIRSGISAPANSTDPNGGSDLFSRPKNNGANVLAVSFDNLVGYSTTAGVYSYTNQGNNAPWGPCEVCHTQTTAYSRTLDNTASHASRTNRCTTCHPHDAAFAPTACKGCHGPDGVAATAPDISAYWATSGHGKASITTNFGRDVECEDCHDTSYLTSTDHKTDGSAGTGPPPANINTQTWPGKPPLTVHTTPNLNTVHLKSGYIDTSGTSRYNIAKTFDQFCNSATGCHDGVYHQHWQATGPPPQDVMRFGDKNTVPNPKDYSWYTLGSYPSDFYRSQSPWTDNDIRLETGLSDAGTSYGLCVSCHDPHGTPTTDTSFYPFIGTSNHMVRGNWKTDSATFCNKACHTKRDPP